MTWNLEQLNALFAKNDAWVVSLEPGCICLTNEDGLDAFVAVSGKQIIIESILFSQNQVNNTAALNEEILKTHQFFPLSNVGITQIANEAYYTAFGAISSSSDEASLLVEVETLFSNVSGFLDAYEQFIN
ncbi:MAG: hypothetical protein RL497_1955 [Pseudomonadota bacterium]|jgi:uncharacterized protein